MSSSTWRRGAVALVVSVMAMAPLSGTAHAAGSKPSRATKVTVKVSKPVAGAARATVKLTVRTPGKAARSKRLVTLHKRAGGRWVKVSRVKAKRTTKAGKVNFSVPRGSARTTWRAKVSAKGSYRGVTKRFTVAARVSTPTRRPTTPPAPSPTNPPLPTPPRPPAPGPSGTPTPPAPTPTPTPTPTPGAGPTPGVGITASFTPLTQNAGALTRFTGSGTVTGAGAGRTVVVETKNGADWTEVARTTTTAGGAWTASFPGDWLFSLPVRAQAPRTSTAAAVVSHTATATTTPFWTPTWNSPDAVSHPHRSPLSRWNPCEGTISYELNLTKAPGVTPERIAASLDEVTLATGLRFEYLGTSTRHAFSAADESDLYDDGRRGSGADLLISFSDDADTDDADGPDFGSGSGTVGYGGFGYWRATRYDVFGQVQQAIFASVALNVEYNDSHLDPAGRVLDSVVKHEVAHAVGLGHAAADKPDQIMAPYVSDEPAEHWGAGDLVGLAHVGAAKGCTHLTPPNGLTALPRTPAVTPEIGFAGYEDKVAAATGSHRP